MQTRAGPLPPRVLGDQEAFLVLVSANDLDSSSVLAAIKQLGRKALATGQMSEPITVDANSTHSVHVINLPPAGDGQDSASTGR